MCSGKARAVAYRNDKTLLNTLNIEDFYKKIVACMSNVQEGR